MMQLENNYRTEALASCRIILTWITEFSQRPKPVRDRRQRLIESELSKLQTTFSSLEDGVIDRFYDFARKAVEETDDLNGLSEQHYQCGKHVEKAIEDIESLNKDLRKITVNLDENDNVFPSYKTLDDLWRKIERVHTSVVVLDTKIESYLNQT